jgi:CDGSH iron-sulfur domain-containing protein 3
MEPKIAQIGPYVVELEEGKQYSWCTCGLSKSQPFCDHSHRIAGEFKSLKFIAEKAGKAYLCGCKRSNNKPYCDGTHNKLK